MEARGQLARAAGCSLDQCFVRLVRQLRAPAKNEPAEAGFSFTLG
jgi:hypothetical protein